MILTNKRIRKVHEIVRKRINEFNAGYIDDIEQEVYLSLLSCKTRLVDKNLEKYVNSIITKMMSQKNKFCRYSKDYKTVNLEDYEAGKIREFRQRDTEYVYDGGGSLV